MVLSKWYITSRINTVNMEEKIYEVLRKHKLPLKKREELIVDLLDLFGVMLSDNKSDELEDFEPSKCWLFDKCKNRLKDENCDDTMPNSQYCYKE
jgi:hypothetical protein